MKKSLIEFLDEVVPGQTEAAAQLLASLGRGEEGHSYIFQGARGWGKAALARLFIRALLCEGVAFSPECGCSACARAADGLHPDVRWFGEDFEKRSIAISDVRELLAWSALRPFEGLRKVAVVLQAERLTVEAANALLKLLEEPPASAYLILLAEQSRRLLDTITSRCRLVRLRPVAYEAVVRALRARGVVEDEAHYAARKSEGSLRSAQKLVEEKAWSLQRHFVEELLGTPSLELFTEWSKLKRPDVVMKLRRLAEWLRDALLVASACRTGELLHAGYPEALQCAGASGTVALLKKLNLLVETERALQANVNQKLALTRLAMAFEMSYAGL